MTRYAIFQNRVVTPEEFDALAGADYRDKGLFPLCPVCDARLSVYGVRSFAVTSRFDHPDFSDCLLSSTPNPRFAYLRPSGWDLEAGKRLKAEFCRPENLKQAYAVCRALCLGSLRGDEFLDLCFAADRYRIWNYAGLPLWAVPYLMVTLVDLGPSRKKALRNDRHNGRRGNPRHALRNDYALRFVLEKPRRTGIEDAWLSPDRCRLACVFADSGNPVKAVAPIPLGTPEIESARDDTAWIEWPLFAILRKCCQRHPDSPCGCGPHQ
jgi:hypothetical protein